MNEENKKDTLVQRQDLFSLLNNNDPKIFTKELYYIIKKLEKLTIVLYKISEKFSDQDPSKNQLRTLALDSLTYFNFVQIHQKRQELQYIWLKITSLLNIIFGLGFITKENYLILKREYDNLAILTESFVESSLETHLKDKEENPFLLDNKPYIKDSLIENLETGKRHNDKRHVFYKKPHYKSDFDDNKILNPHIKNPDRESRTTRIIDIVKSKGDVSIKDISLIMKDVGEKTIQRELLRLTENGILQKKGERRWSRYFI